MSLNEKCKYLNLQLLAEIKKKHNRQHDYFLIRKLKLFPQIVTKRFLNRMAIYQQVGNTYVSLVKHSVSDRSAG